MGDYIKRADAIEAVQKIVPYVIDNDTGQWGILVNKANVITELSALPSADAEPKRVLQGYNKGANTIQTIRHEELTQIANTRKAVESADAVSEDTQTEERARFVAKETELAHIEARLENAEKRLQELPKYTNCMVDRLNERRATEEKARNELVQMVKAAGYYLQDNADDIVDRAGLKTGMEIRIVFDPGEMAEVEIIQRHFAREFLEVINKEINR